MRPDARFRKPTQPVQGIVKILSQIRRDPRPVLRELVCANATKFDVEGTARMTPLPKADGTRGIIAARWQGVQKMKKV
jgi:hypothetical protein